MREMKMKITKSPRGKCTVHFVADGVRSKSTNMTPEQAEEHAAKMVRVFLTRTDVPNGKAERRAAAPPS